MAKTGGDPAGRGGSQFFIVVATDAGFPPDYAVIGQVSDGLGVIDKIGKLGAADETPPQVVEIAKATAEEPHDRRGRRARRRRATRYGSPKQLVFLPYVLERLAATSVADVVVVEGAYPIPGSVRRRPRRDVSRLGARARREPPLRPRGARGRRRGRAGRARRRPAARPRAVERLIEHRGDADVVVASYDGTRDHPAVVSRAAWRAIPDEGARALQATLVACDDLEPPGDMDYPDLWQPPAAADLPLLERLPEPHEPRHQLGRHRLVDRDLDEAPQILLEAVPLVATRAVGEVLPRLLHLSSESIPSM